jgi:hypothetical protein
MNALSWPVIRFGLEILVPKKSFGHVPACSTGLRVD